jgi:hypothetical protein
MLTLMLSETFAVIQKLVAPPWSQLEELDLGSSRLKIPNVELLVKKSRPLKILRLRVHVTSLNVASVAGRSLQGSSCIQMHSIDLASMLCQIRTAK